MRILLVEDDPVLALLAAATLADEHEVIGPAYDASHALLLAAQYKADVAFVDINLNGHDEGIALARRLRAQHGLASLFVSGQVVAAHAHCDAAMGLLRKPYAPDDLNRCAEIAQAILDGQALSTLHPPGSLEIFSTALQRLPSDEADDETAK
ncbi:MAG TPA: response regulator [Pseudomonas sp.]|jgi:CheY-like chemotaxis protein